MSEVLDMPTAAQPPTLDLQPRKDFFGEIGEAVPTRQTFPLMHEIGFAPALLGQLRRALNVYLAATLQADAAVATGSVDDAEFLAENYDRLRQCPNITPNGIVLPKLENVLEFNIVHRTVVDIFAGTGIMPFLGRIHLPFSIRLVGGTLNEALHRRPFAATKLHTEIWSGHPNDGVVSIPICGNVAGTMPEFFEPIHPTEAFVSKLDDYDDAHDFYERLERYDVDVGCGFYYLYDAFVVHRTVKRGGGPRISIDFPVMYARALDALKLPQDRLENYVEQRDWAAIGLTQLMYSAESFADIRSRLEQERHAPAEKIRYAAKFERVRLG